MKKKSGLTWVWIAVLIILADRFTKVWVVSSLLMVEPLRIMSILDFTLAYNRGAAFSFLHTASGWQNIFFTALAFIICIAILYWLTKIPVKAWWTSIALSLILGGALGNAWDRMEFGYVIDFIHFHLGDWNFAIFNIADSAICIGAIMLLIKWTLPKYCSK